MRGITHALEVLGTEVVVQMDADFSHDPTDARKLLAHLAGGADVAIGSRYVAGGAVDERWSVGRRLLSRWTVGLSALRGSRRSKPKCCGLRK